MRSRAVRGVDETDTTSYVVFPVAARNTVPGTGGSGAGVEFICASNHTVASVSNVATGRVHSRGTRPATLRAVLFRPVDTGRGALARYPAWPIWRPRVPV